MAYVKHPGNSDGPANDLRFNELEKENMDLKNTNRAKEMGIELMQMERDGFIEKLLISSGRLGN